MLLGLPFPSHKLLFNSATKELCDMLTIWPHFFRNERALCLKKMGFGFSEATPSSLLSKEGRGLLVAW
jgi:hypothetical protein